MKSVIIDTDPAIGLSFRDVDDGLAIIFLLAAGVDLRGLTINFGNTKMEKAYKIAKELLSVCQRNDIKVLRGAKSPEDLGEENEAVRFLREEVNNNPNKITILAIAPLTNIATAIKIDPQFLSKVKELVIMGGTLKYRLSFPLGEYNFWCDSQAASIVLTSKFPKTVITLDLCLQTLFTLTHYTHIKKKKSPVCEYITDKIRSWLILNLLFPFRGGFYPWDVVGAAYITHPEIFEDKPVYYNEDKDRLKKGCLVLSEEKKDNSVLINIPDKINQEKFSQIIIEHLTKL